ncbi:alpha/beta hydrolase [Neotabrizicola sp. VNH66]|uniref:alpha/beta hydrolase n=1 Tax=Neotabrizicola sp. VNH66 TaxID=3400918 RepID=UPI003C03D8DD
MAQDLYRNRDFIPDFDAIIAETAARSREVSARTDLRADIAYGPGLRERMDILLPKTPAQGAPLHLFIHGGYWRSGSKEDHRLVAAPVLAAGGICAVLTYDLMPETRLGAIVAQVRAAARHLTGIAPSLGADPGRLTVSGHSAGAHLASYLAAYAPHEPMPDLPALRGLLLVSGIYDLSGIPGSFLKDEAKMTPAEAADWSPMTSTHQPDLPRIITRGQAETAPFQQQAAALAALLPGSELRQEPGLDHLAIVLALGDPQASLGRRLSELVAAS